MFRNVLTPLVRHRRSLMPLRQFTALAEATTSASFESFGLDNRVASNLRAANIDSFFEVQLKVLKETSLDDEGKDLIVRSKTGSGKTLAFGMPFIHKLLSTAHNQEVGKPRGLIMAPTRELAQQVEKELAKYANGLLNGVTVYGGASYTPQLEGIFSRNTPCDYIVGTPGRIHDLVEGGKLDLSNVSVAVLDEADEMLKVGFKDAIDSIFVTMPDKDTRLNLLFSATFSNDVRRVATEYMRSGSNIVNINLLNENDSKIPDTIDMEYVVVGPRSRVSVLANILAAEKNPKSLIFCETKRECDSLASAPEFAQLGITAGALHGDMSQQLRESALAAFRVGKVQALIATDVAARGLDIDDVNLVIHSNFPNNRESFIHRSGRTGRAGKSGRNLVVMGDYDDQRYFFNEYEKLSGRTFQQVAVPSAQSNAEEKMQEIVESLNQIESTLPSYDKVARQLIDQASNDEASLTFLVSALLMKSSGAHEIDTCVSVLNGKPNFVSIHIHDRKTTQLNYIRADAEKLCKDGVGCVIDVYESKLEKAIQTLNQDSVKFTVLKNGVKVPRLVERPGMAKQGFGSGGRGFGGISGPSRGGGGRGRGGNFGRQDRGENSFRRGSEPRRGGFGGGRSRY